MFGFRRACVPSRGWTGPPTPWSLDYFRYGRSRDFRAAIEDIRESLQDCICLDLFILEGLDDRSVPIIERLEIRGFGQNGVYADYPVKRGRK